MTQPRGNRNDPFWRRILTILLAVSGIGLMVYYNICDTDCSYLRGDIWGVDLKIVGILYMLVLILCALLNQSAIVRMALAGGLGVEAFLFSFQVRADVYCPFCLAFAVLVIAAFSVNYRPPPPMENPWRRWLISGLGEVVGIAGLWNQKSIPLLLFAALGYLFVALTFNGTITPSYGTPSRPAASSVLAAGTFPADPIPAGYAHLTENR